MEAPQGDITRDEIINSYIKTLATVVGSEEEARMKIYSVSTRCYYAFGALVSEEVSLKIKELPGVRWVLPDSYLDVKNKDYEGEPFINGQAVAYDPKYHEEWIRNNSRANERNRRNDGPRKFDRSRNIERRRENMQNRDFQNMGPSHMPNQAGPNSGPGPANMVLHPPTGVQCLPTWVLHPPTGLQCSLPTWVLHPPTGLQCRLPTWVHQTTTIITSQATTGILGHRTAIIRCLPTATIRCRPTTTIRCLPITRQHGSTF
ncbi:unnamed protein product [Malus baccata var. baccata]